MANKKGLIMAKNSILGIIIVFILLIGAGFFVHYSNSEYIGGNVLNLPYHHNVPVKEGSHMPRWLSNGTMLHLMFRTPFLASYGLENLSLDLVDFYTISDDGLEYSFGLKQGIKWSDGVDMTLDDVLFTFHIIAKSPYLPSLYKRTFSRVKTLAIEDNLIKIELSEPYPNFLRTLSQCPIFPRHAFEEYITPENFYTSSYWQKPIGNGMYMISEIDDERYIKFERNPYYTGKKPNIDKVILHKDISVQVDLQLTTEVSTMKSYNSMTDIGEYILPIHLYRYLLYNIEGDDGNTNPAMQDYNVRKAISKAINRDEIIKLLYNDLTPSPLTEPFLASQEALFYNLEEAKESLAKSNYNLDRPLRLGYYYNDMSSYYYTQKIAHDLTIIGFKVELVKLQSIDDLHTKRNFDIALKDFLAMHPSDRFQEFHSSHEFTKLFGSHNEFDALIAKAFTATRGEEYDQVSFDIHELASQRLYRTPVSTLPMARYVNEARIKLPKNTKFGSPSFITDTNFANWQIKKD